MIDDIVTLEKVKAELGNGYQFYGFTDEGVIGTSTVGDGTFFGRLKEIAEEVRIREMVPGLGATYTDIEGDYATLSGNQWNVFYAEVYYICGDFVASLKNSEMQARKAEKETISVEGFERSMEGDTGLEKSESWYYARAAEHMNLA